MFGEVSYDERMMEEPEKKKEVRKNRPVVYNETIQQCQVSYPPKKKSKKYAGKKEKTKHIHLVWNEVSGYDKVVVQDIQQPWPNCNLLFEALESHMEGLHVCLK